MNWYIFLADVVVFFHLAYVLFVIVCVPVILLGGWLKWSWVRNFWFRIVHFLMMAIVVVETVFGVTCPMTNWERDLRLAAGQLELVKDEDGNYQKNEQGAVPLQETQALNEDFVGRCLRRILFFNPQDVSQWILNLCYYVFGGLVLMTLILVKPHWPWKKSQNLTFSNLFV